MNTYIIKCDGVTQIIHASSEAEATRRFKNSNPLVNYFASMTIKVK